MYSSMSPTIVIKKGKVHLVFNNEDGNKYGVADPGGWISEGNVKLNI